MHDEPSAQNTLERLEKAEQLKLMGRHEEALSILEKLLIEDPENVSALEEVSDNELSMENYERAHKAAKQAVEFDGNSYTGHYILGFLSSLKQRWSEAVDHLRKANELRPNNAEILRCLGWALFGDGQRAQGIVTLERALNLDEENPLTLCDLGVAYLQTRNFSKAKTLLERATDIDPGNARAIECLKAIERVEKALQEEGEHTNKQKKRQQQTA